MNKRIGLIAVVLAGVLAIGLCYGFLNGKGEKPVGALDQRGLGMPFPNMMAQLSQNMGIWGNMSSNEKTMAVSAVIGLYKGKDNAAILNTPEFYVQKINETLAANPPVANADILTLMRILAVMEYDFFNGENKDDLAKKVLGARGYEENKARRQAQAQKPA